VTDTVTARCHAEVRIHGGIRGTKKATALAAIVTTPVTVPPESIGAPDDARWLVQGGRLKHSVGQASAQTRTAIAHLAEDGREHSLQAHLESVSHLAGEFGAKWGAGSFGEVAGLLHDLGKYASDFQAYIREVVVTTTGTSQFCAARREGGLPLGIEARMVFEHGGVVAEGLSIDVRVLLDDRRERDCDNDGVGGR